MGEQNNITLSIPISALENNNLTIKTDFGAISVSNKTLQRLLKLYSDDVIRLVLKKGSFIFALVDVDNKEINYNDPENPFIISLPYILTNGQGTDSVVAAKKTNENNTLIPLATYKDGNFIFSTASTGTYGLIYNPRAFKDTENHWANNIISFVSARELFTGIGNGNFSPDVTMTRAMFLAVLARLDGADLSQYKSSRFNDVPFGEWYSSSIEWAADKGLVVGIGNDKFEPNSPITREQMATVLDNYIKYKDYEIQSLPSKSTVLDDSISPWAKIAVETIQKAGIINENPNNLYEPQGLSTRAEAVAVFVKLIEAINR